LAVVGNAWLVITTSSCTAAHIPLLIVQRNVALLPAANPVTAVVSNNALVIDTAPLTILQTPVPVVAALAAIANVLLLHCTMSDPAIATVGATGAKFRNTTSSVLTAQMPLLIVQRNVTLLPAVKPVTALTFEPGVSAFNT
jgi:hypothetical protein